MQELYIGTKRSEAIVDYVEELYAEILYKDGIKHLHARTIIHS